jgi:hypothetical protein
MRVSIIILFIAGVLLHSEVRGQQIKPVINFNDKEYNFGTFTEAAGIVTHDFIFTNQGKAPLLISNVKTSCGCTAPEWPHEPVLPGKNGTIRISFDPKDQEGSFNKTIQVYSNADPPVVNLAIKGVVIPAESFNEVYKFTIGDVRFETVYASFGEIVKGSKPLYRIKVFNASHDKPVTITFRQLPAHLKARIIPETLSPQQEGVIEIEFNSAAVNEWDYVVNRLDLLMNGQNVPNSRLNITANIKEDFSGLTASDMAASPMAKFDETSFDFGTINDKTLVEHSFILTNAGKSDLFIRKVSASCGCTAVQPDKTQIRPGESTAIKSVFNPAGREGSQKKAITVITSDPKHSKIILWISGSVIKSDG